MRDVAPSKLTPPALPRDLVARPALGAALDAGADRALTLVSAPPGFGKSLLLAEWVRRRPAVPAAWVTLDEDDADPRPAWNAVLAALRGCPAVPPSSRLHRLVVSRTTVELDFLDDLVDGLAALPSPLRLVLDDVQHLRGGPVVDGLRLLVRRHPPGLQLVLATRLDPALPLARLRLEDDLCEVRAGQLRFSAREAAALLARSGVHLDPRRGALLHARTGGWVAGLRLAARSLRGHPDPDGFLAAFSGDERSVADYLVDEVLAGVTDAQREVLRVTSVTDPVPAALAVELCGREDAADVLDSLTRELGLVTLDGPEPADYRVQELLRSYLRSDLRRRGAGRLAELHRRAARWWDRHGGPAQAIGHAGQAGDPALVVALLRGRAAELVARGEQAALRTALGALGDGPDTAGWRAALPACLDLERGDRQAAAPALRRARDTGGTGGTEPDLAVLLAAAARLTGLDRHPPGPEALPEDPVLRAWARAGRGAALAATGSFTAGRAELAAALDAAGRLGMPLLALQCRCVLGAAAWADGDLAAAAAAGAEATAAARDGGWAATGWAACAHAVSALAALEQARPDAALDAADTALRTAPADLDPAVRAALRVARGAALADRGDGPAGLLELQQARAETGAQPLPTALTAAAALVEHRVALRLGYASAAAGAASRLDGCPGTDLERLLARAWAQAAAGAHRAARGTVAPLLRPAARPAWRAAVVEAWLVESDGALRDGDRPGARHALRVALDHALALDAVRPFTVASPAVRALLVDELVAGDARGDLAARALDARAARPAAVLLTGREQDVLARLPSLLNLDEIADDLAVSVNTVKSHVRSIYDKLGAGTRRTAVLAAHRQGLLRREGSSGTPARVRMPASAPRPLGRTAIGTSPDPA